MEKHNVRILVCTHKEGPVRDDDIYMPVQVGKSASTIDLGCQGDDVGDNISGKNKTYCELTGLYWAWKNLKDVDYIGLCHYRRYFDLSPKKYIFKHIESDSITWECFVKTPSTLDFADVFTQYDVILPTARVFDRSVVDEHIFNSGFIDYMILEQVILKLYPAYRNSVLDVFYKKNYIPQRNMFIMKKELFHCYAEWLFSILYEVEKHLRLSPYHYAQRVFGFMGEILLPLFCYHNHLRIYQRRILGIGCGYNPNKLKRTVCAFFDRARFKMNTCRITELYSERYPEILCSEGIVI